MYYIGIDLGGTNISMGIVDGNYNIVQRSKVKTSVPRSELEICDSMMSLIHTTLCDMGMNIDEIESVGIGVPGSVNVKAGVVEHAPNLFFHNWNLKKMMEDKIKKSIFIENDANAAVYGEYLAGSARGADSAIMITIGTGIGGGIILNGKIYYGCNFNGAELGHMVIHRNGRECTCGRKGCFEKYASASGLIKTTKEALNRSGVKTLIWDLIDNNIENIDSKTVFKAMRLGDELGKAIVNEYVLDLSCGLVNIINIFQPDVLCIGGGVSNEGEYLINPVIEVISKERFSKTASKQVHVKRAELGNDAGIVGAAFLHKL